MLHICILWINIAWICFHFTSNTLLSFEKWHYKNECGVRSWNCAQKMLPAPQSATTLSSQSKYHHENMRGCTYAVLVWLKTCEQSSSVMEFKTFALIFHSLQEKNSRDNGRDLNIERGRSSTNSFIGSF